MGLQIDIEVIPFFERGDPIRVDMQQRDPGIAGGHLARHDEGRAGDLFVDPQSTRDSLGEGRLACAEISRKHDYVAPDQRCADGAADLSSAQRRIRRNRELVRHSALTARSRGTTVGIHIATHSGDESFQ